MSTMPANRNASYIRFSYDYTPRVWIRVPRFVAVLIARSDFWIDTIVGRKRKAPSNDQGKRTQTA